MSRATSSSRPRAVDPTSWQLLARARAGEVGALSALLSRYLPPLRHWAHGRLARWARSGADTSDLVQDAVLRTIPKIGTFDARGRRALGAYLQQAVQNRLRDEHRRLARRAPTTALSDQIAAPDPSPLDNVMSREQENRYRAALAGLTPGDRELIVAHLELDYSHEQLGCMTGRTPNAARMALQRAIRRLVERMRDARP
jgi:RNA polymerase sigma factor (sigma-70 family)